MYSTEKIDFEDKVIYQRYHFQLPSFKSVDCQRYDLPGFNWLLAELDMKDSIGFGWANLNSDENAEWGYIYLPDVEGTGAEKDDNWAPISFHTAKALVHGYRQWPGSKEHHEWWKHENSNRLKVEYAKMTSQKIDFDTFEKRVYRKQHNLVKS